jgi:atypical dual specificity phosphatase
MSEDKQTDVIKFPRTKHLVNLGASSRDDLQCNEKEQKEFLGVNVYVQEKVDGANLGIFLDEYKLIAQNRSHFVTSTYHPQFKLLDKWLLQHAEDLYHILTPDDILYGEWLYAQHSINYTELPDYFLAYDIYNKKTKQFYNYEYVVDKLKGTKIKMVPLICYGKMKKLEEFTELIKTKSKFYDGQIEGIYVRICDDKFTINRAKIVRSDFIGGNDHWTKNKITVNGLAG